MMAVFQDAHTVRAQAITTPVPEQQSPPPAPITAGWQDAFVVQSANGDFRLQIGLLLQADGRFALTDSDGSLMNTFLLRRARPYLRGRFARRFEFFFDPDFAGGTLVVQDAYLDTVFAPAFRIRIGKGKTPFGLERLHSASNLLFVDRAAPTALVPNRDLGIQVLGDISGGLVSYLGGIMNGVPDGGSADTDANDSKDLSGRVVVRPLSRTATSRLKGLGLAMAGSVGRQSGSGALSAFRTSLGQQQYFSYSGAVADGVRTRYSPQLFYYYKAFGGFAEFVHTSMPIRGDTARDEVEKSAWQVAASIVLTGEVATDAAAGVRPRAGFDSGKGGPGALQLAARYHTLSVDETADLLGVVTPGSSRKAEAWTVGLNWFLTPNLKHVFNFERTVFDDGRDGARPAEHVFVFRTQVNF
jgi:phosphate-selective porin OprO/OprP